MANGISWQSVVRYLPVKRSAVIFAAVLIAVLAGFVGPVLADTVICDGELSPTPVPRIAGEPQVGQQPDLLVRSTCLVKGSPHFYNTVNIVAGGKLIFIEPDVEPREAKTQDFWASAILIENNGEMLAGVSYSEKDPVTQLSKVTTVEKYGTNDKTLQIHLYGKDPGKGEMGALCVEPEDIWPGRQYTDCGIPRADMWDTNGSKEVLLPGATPTVAPTDYFYKYGSLHGDKDSLTGEKIGHFGNKTIGLSYGGTLRLRGVKGTSGTSAEVIETKLLADPESLKSADMPAITDSGTSWTRLAGVEGATLTLDRSVSKDWGAGDQIVVTSTDYSPEHSEVATIASVDGATVTLNAPLKYTHSATKYPVGLKIGTKQTAFRDGIEKVDGKDPAFLKSAETRAAVGLLTRSIRILSAGDKLPPPSQGPYSATDDFDKQAKTYSYGAQAVFREGFKQLQIQGVEFAQMGQGGAMGRYPVHFHETRRVPKDTYVIDSSINESMTRWVVIHSTLGVTLARNVGYRSIGHGFYLEDSTETDNKLYANLGVFARAGVYDHKDAGANPANPREIPGILSARNEISASVALKYHSDAQYPSVFWITNGWNSFAGNMAAGAGTCGACYWVPSTANHDMMDIPPGDHGAMTPMTWKGYSAIQAGQRYGRSPIRMFYANSCSTAMHAFNNSDGSTCGMVLPIDPTTGSIVKTIPNENAALRPAGGGDESEASKMYYPRYSGQRRATICDPNVPIDDPKAGCRFVDCQNDAPEHCAVTTVSHFTTSFNWAEGNFSSVWMRSGWLMFDHGFISDVQGGGITQVSGGDYTRSSVPQGYWALTSNSIFVGQTQPNTPAAQLAHPEGCTMQSPPFDRYCLFPGSSTAIPVSTAAMMVGQRLYNVYDGPAYEDANAYLDIKVSPCDTDAAKCMTAQKAGVRKAAAPFAGIAKGKGYLPNAAIGWKQPNGFYYPPAFHSRNLFFSEVDIRHYVIEPLTFTGRYVSDPTAINNDYLFTPTNIFNNWTDVDRQTELNDDDGSLTGLTSASTAFANAVNSTISLNEDAYFRAPVQTAQCKSNIGVDPKDACAPQPSGDRRISVPTARTSPYDQITTVIYPGCAVAADEGAARQACDESKVTASPWGQDCTNESCYGAPLYRNLLTADEWQTWNAAPLTPAPTGSTVQPKSEPSCETSAEKLKAMPPGPAYKTALEAFVKTCRVPFIRMAGASAWQRSVLTANNGTYYIDTTVSKDNQLTTEDLISDNRKINVFGKGKTYYVFFLFAKNDGKSNVTKQTYQIYVGPGFQESSVKGVKITPKGFPLSLDSVKDWANFPWKPKPVGADGILTVEVDFSKVPTTEIDPHTTTAGASVLHETCKPVSFCKRDGNNACGCDEAKTGIMGSLIPGFNKVCESTCKEWGVKDLDCPGDGCRGFSFTLPETFEADDKYRRPKPQAFPLTAPWSTIQFKQTSTQPDKGQGADCNYDGHVPGQGQCKVVE